MVPTPESATASLAGVSRPILMKSASVLIGEEGCTTWEVSARMGPLDDGLVFANGSGAARAWTAAKRKK